MLVSTTAPNSLPANQVPATFRIGAVTAPGQPVQGSAALVSGLLLGPFPVQLAQVTAALPTEAWPTQGQELPAVVDPNNPLHFGVVWSVGPDTEGADQQPQWQHGSGWDAGPNGEHATQIAEWLAANGFTAGDFGDGLESVAPGLTVLLDQACAKYSTVIRGRDAVALMRNGQPATGVVAQFRQLPIPPQMLPNPDASMGWITLDVTPHAGEPYRTTIRFGFRSPEKQAQMATVGTTLPLRVDPRDRTKVTIDLPALGITPG